MIQRITSRKYQKRAFYLILAHCDECRETETFHTLEIPEADWKPQEAFSAGSSWYCRICLASGSSKKKERKALLDILKAEREARKLLKGGVEK